MHAQKPKYADLLLKPDAICRNVSCTKESMAESIDRATAKPPLAKRRHFQMFEKACNEKWPLVTIDEKGDTSVNVNSEARSRSTVVKWLDWWTVEI